MFYAYIYRDPRTGAPFYVGKGTGKRHAHHKTPGCKNRTVAGRISKIRAAGLEPSVEVIPAIDEGHAFFMESCLIDVLGRRDKGRGPLLNLTDGGEGASGLKVSEATRRRMSSVKTGTKLSEEHKRKLADASRGRVLSPESRAKISAAKKGIPKSHKHREAARMAKFGLRHSDETRRKMSEQRKGKPKSEQARANMKSAQIERFRKARELKATT